MIGKSSRNLKVSRLLFCFAMLETHFSHFADILNVWQFAL